jgi:hypothetical protein
MVWMFKKILKKTGIKLMPKDLKDTSAMKLPRAHEIRHCSCV